MKTGLTVTAHDPAWSPAIINTCPDTVTELLPLTKQGPEASNRTWPRHPESHFRPMKLLACNVMLLNFGACT